MIDCQHKERMYILLTVNDDGNVVVEDATLIVEDQND